MAHLWESEHRYYCNEGNYHTSEDVEVFFETWSDFLSEFGDSDMDYNLVFRWDWKRADPVEYRKTDELLIFFMGQRKGSYYYARIDGIREEDEPSVREWLQPRFEHLLSLWSPLSDEGI